MVWLTWIRNAASAALGASLGAMATVAYTAFAALSFTAFAVGGARATEVPIDNGAAVVMYHRFGESDYRLRQPPRL